LIISWNITIEHSEFPAKHLLPHLFFADCDQKTELNLFWSWFWWGVLL